MEIHLWSGLVCRIVHLGILNANPLCNSWNITCLQSQFFCCGFLDKPSWCRSSTVSDSFVEHIAAVNYKSCRRASLTLLGVLVKAGVLLFNISAIFTALMLLIVLLLMSNLETSFWLQQTDCLTTCLTTWFCRS